MANSKSSQNTKIKSSSAKLITSVPQRDWLALGPALNKLVAEYKQPVYVASDPIQFPYRYSDTDAETVELVAFIAAMFSYGRREQVIASLNKIFARMGQSPMSYLEGFDPKQERKHFQDFVHRFNTGEDVLFLLSRLQAVYAQHGSLEALFATALDNPIVTSNQASSLSPDAHSFISAEHFKAALGTSLDTLIGSEAPDRYGVRFLFAHPARGGACKRFNMFLRWMVREDKEPSGRVDFGLWKKALEPKDLRIPLDAHVMNMNRQLGFSSRKDTSWKTVEEITDVFRLLSPHDPIQYDYALFGFSLEKRAISEILGSK